MGQKIKIIQNGMNINVFIDDIEIKSIKSLGYYASADEAPRVILDIYAWNLENNLLNPIDISINLHNSEEE